MRKFLDFIGITSSEKFKFSDLFVIFLGVSVALGLVLFIYNQ